MRNAILNGHVLDQLRLLASSSVHCVVTSPPYWGLRDYGIEPSPWPDGSRCCFGLEPTVKEYVAHTLFVFNELRRVLRDDGVIFWNLGDSYSTTGKSGGWTGGKHRRELYGSDARRMAKSEQAAVGNKLLIPHRVAIALQDDGWCIRQDTVWAKKSPMPESLSGWRWRRCRVKVNGTGWTKENHPDYQPVDAGKGSIRAFGINGGPVDPSAAKWRECPGCDACRGHGGFVLRRGAWRPTNAHEYVLMITKSHQYFCDGDAVAELAIGRDPGNQNHKFATGFAMGLSDITARETRNQRSIWSIASEPYKGAHFATFPTAIPARCIAAATSSHGCCATCGSQYAPVIATVRIPTRPGTNTKVHVPSGHGSIHQDGRSLVPEYTSPVRRDPNIIGNRDPQRHVARTIVEGYRPTCDCPGTATQRALVLDPFLGSGTTAAVAAGLGRDWIGIEINSAYVALAEARIAAGWQPKTSRPRSVRRRRRMIERSLFDELFGVETLKEGVPECH